MATDLVTDVGGAVESIVVRKGTPLVMQGGSCGTRDDCGFREPSFGK